MLNQKMSKKLYIDTNIILDAINGRKNLFGKVIGNSASDLFFISALCKYKLIISTWTLEELSKFKTLNETSFFFEFIKHKVITIEHSKEDIIKAKQENRVNYHDQLHGVLALKSKADYIVTRNVDDFKKVKNIAITKPESLLD